MKIDINNEYMKDIYEEIELDEQNNELIDAQLILEGKLILEEESDDEDSEEHEDESEEDNIIVGVQHHIAKSIKKNNKMTLLDFNKKVDDEIKANEPKKFTSKRSTDKKKLNPTSNIDIIKRKFNPRNPPYNFVHKERKDDNIIINLEDFPEL